MQWKARKGAGLKESNHNKVRTLLRGKLGIHQKNLKKVNRIREVNVKIHFKCLQQQVPYYIAKRGGQ